VSGTPDLNLLPVFEALLQVFGDHKRRT